MSKHATQAETGTGSHTADNTEVISPLSGSTGLSKQARKKLHKYMLKKDGRDDHSRSTKLAPDAVYTHILKSPANRHSLRIATHANLATLVDRQHNLTTKNKTLNQAEIYKPVQAHNYCNFASMRARHAKKANNDNKL